MELNEYQREARRTAAYPQEMKIIYPTIGLAGETGEVAEKVKKVIRDHEGEFSEAQKAEIAKELGDVLWYVASIAADMGYPMDDIARLNIEKIRSRAERSKIHGEGDNR
ncbi:MAG: nucleoside triphosphate pyrophosphohydrolase family protein [Prevotella sp.]|nr:nucleoside triphosphate pyrophosphohydrolase family protein [Prevotella sp.]